MKAARRSKQVKWIIAGSLLAAVVLIVTMVSLHVAHQTREAAKEVQQSQEQDPEPSPQVEEEQELVEPEPEVVPEEDEADALDPDTVGVIDIEPAGISVSYIKGVGGFQYQVLRSSDGRKYVELKNESLIGTKCENDTGVFASIVEAPNESEKTTVSKTTSVDDVEYGLSVASPTCTNDQELLERYQEAFVKPFTLLKKVD